MTDLSSEELIIKALDCSLAASGPDLVIEYKTDMQKTALISELKTLGWYYIPDDETEEEAGLLTFSKTPYTSNDSNKTPATMDSEILIKAPRSIYIFTIVLLIFLSFIFYMTIQQTKHNTSGLGILYIFSLFFIFIDYFIPATYTIKLTPDEIVISDVFRRMVIRVAEIESCMFFKKQRLRDRLASTFMLVFKMKDGSKCKTLKGSFKIFEKIKNEMKKRYKFSIHFQGN